MQFTYHTSYTLNISFNSMLTQYLHCQFICVFLKKFKFHMYWVCRIGISINYKCRIIDFNFFKINFIDFTFISNCHYWF